MANKDTQEAHQLLPALLDTEIIIEASEWTPTQQVKEVAAFFGIFTSFQTTQTTKRKWAQKTRYTVTYSDPRSAKLFTWVLVEMETHPVRGTKYTPSDPHTYNSTTSNSKTTKYWPTDDSMPKPNKEFEARLLAGNLLGSGEQLQSIRQ